MRDRSALECLGRDWGGGGVAGEADAGTLTGRRSAGSMMHAATHLGSVGEQKDLVREDLDLGADLHLPPGFRAVRGGERQVQNPVHSGDGDDLCKREGGGEGGCVKENGGGAQGTTHNKRK